MKKLFIIAALAITSTTVMADDTNWYLGGGIVDSKGQFDDSADQSDISTDSKLLELGYNGEIFGSNVYAGKYDDSREFINDSFVGAEIDAGWKFHLGDNFTIKPYGLVGVEGSENNDPTFKAGVGLMTTFKFLYLDIEVAEQNTDFADSSETTDKFNETSTTATIGFTF